MTVHVCVSIRVCVCVCVCVDPRQRCSTVSREAAGLVNRGWDSFFTENSFQK